MYLIPRSFRTTTISVITSIVALASLSACDNLLEVEAPGRIVADSLRVPANARLMVEGARAAFGCALQAYVNGAALLTDEMEDRELVAGAWPWDRRDWTGALGEIYAEGACTALQNFGVYRPLQTARFAAEDAAATISGFTDAEVTGRGALIAEAHLLLGYSRVLLGEGFCVAAENLGPRLNPADFFNKADESFTQAMAGGGTAGQAPIVNAARVGRARARLGLARLPGQAVDVAKYDQAKADAQTVPPGFVYAIPYNVASVYSQNTIVQRNRVSLYYGVAPAYRNLGDPRIQVTNSGLLGNDRLATIWTADKYSSLSSPISLARYVEAQLIIAEAELAAGHTSAAIDMLNVLRGRPGVGLPSYSGATDAAAIQAFLLSERSKELFLEGQHFWDINRFRLPLDPAPGALFSKGGTYADLRCMPLPDIERLNNPNID